MKTIAILFLALTTAAFAEAPKPVSVPLTGNDIAEVLGLDIQKYQFTFSAPTKIKAEVVGGDGKVYTFSLPPTCSKATLTVYSEKPNPETGKISMSFKLMTDSDGSIVRTWYRPESSKKYGSISRTVGNDFIIVGLDEKDMAEEKIDTKTPLFRFCLTTGD